MADLVAEFPQFRGEPAQAFASPTQRRHRIMLPFNGRRNLSTLLAISSIPPTVKQFVDGAMVAFFDASATSAIEAAFVSSGQQLLSPVNSNTIVFLGEAFSTSSIHH
jgi:hypothetical protein